MKRCVRVSRVGLAVAGAALSTVSVAEGRDARPRRRRSPRWTSPVARGARTTTRPCGPHGLPTGDAETLKDGESVPGRDLVGRRAAAALHRLPGGGGGAGPPRGDRGRPRAEPAPHHGEVRRPGGHPGQAADAARRVRPERERRLLGLGAARPPVRPGGCVTEPAGTLLSGPLHNELPDPATNGTGRDNNTFWVPDFSPSHYDKIIYSQGRADQEGAPRPRRRRRPARPHGAQLLPRDVQGHVRGHRHGERRG